MSPTRASKGLTAYREAVKDHSPGLQPWVRRPKKIALKEAAEVAALENPRVDVIGRISRSRQHTQSWTHIFSGATFRALAGPADPGLKPWATLSSRFAASGRLRRNRFLGSAGQSRPKTTLSQTETN